MRFVHPHGDELFATVIETPLENPFTTSAGSTRVRVNQPNHGFVTGDMIKISGVAAPVDNIAPENFNDYHIVYKVNNNAYDIILFWNKTPLGGPGSSPEPSPAASATGAANVGGNITVHTLYFDQAKFSEWLLTHYFSGWHACCSCRMGLEDDSLAVVDTRARVYEAKVKSGKTHVKGSLASLKNADYVISFYSDNQLIGKKRVSTDKNGKAKFSAKLGYLSFGSEVRATATRT